MSRRSKLTDEERISAVQEYLNGEGSYRSIARKYGVDHKLLRVLVGRAQTEGIESIKIRPVNRKYTVETKLAAVQEYLAGKGSQLDICKKYHITNNNLLIQWIKCYNNGKDFRDRRRSERGITMNKGRKTTQEERIEIVAFCIENGKDYGLTMEKYGVSYQQIYLWVRKYEEKGIDGLIDRRGKAKPEDELTEADRLRMENKILQAKLKDKEMELKLVKKLIELEGGDW
ncbi:helix-turn-helix domain-containing protein [Ruminococcus sp.]|uniref:helix-turn-helix domain-containing protein n=1 Tax=Ruminococcus sp. TaxID=41978 RepID=UPI0025DD61DC|nr:helix-turn-helix domain-containing protein [Ruminococcus sp.]